MGEAQLRGDGADLVAKHAENGDLGHHIAIDVDGGDGLVLLVQHEEEEKVALAAVAVADALVVVAKARVDAHEQYGGEPTAVLIGLPVLLKRLWLFKAAGQIAAHGIGQRAAAKQQAQSQRQQFTKQASPFHHVLSPRHRAAWSFLSHPELRSARRFPAAGTPARRCAYLRACLCPRGRAACACPPW